jgi:hypothetical protein
MPQGAEPGPIAIFASGHRCGSTLVQRLLNSHPEVRIWGEHWGLVNGLLELGSKWRWWGEQSFATDSREALVQDGTAAWMPNLMPGGDPSVEAVRAFLHTMFARPAEAEGRSRWGFKEVRYGAPTARMLREVYPGLRVLHLTRSPASVLASLDAWEQEGLFSRADTQRAIGFWRSINESMLELRGEPWVLAVRYEDVVADPPGFVRRLSEFTGLDAARLDLGVFAQRVHGPGARGREWRRTRSLEELDGSLQGLIADPAIVRLAGEYGYELPAMTMRRRTVRLHLRRARRALETPQAAA